MWQSSVECNEALIPQVAEGQAQHPALEVAQEEASQKEESAQAEKEEKGLMDVLELRVRKRIAFLLNRYMKKRNITDYIRASELGTVLGDRKVLETITEIVLDVAKK